MADADYLQASIEAHPSLEMMSSRMWTNVCFRYTSADDGVDLNDLNTEIRNRLMKEGSFMVSRSNIGDDVVIAWWWSTRALTATRLTASLVAPFIMARKFSEAFLPPTERQRMFIEPSV